MPIEMVWNDLKFHLTHCVHPATENDLVREAKNWWNSKMNNVTYGNKKIDHIYRVVDRVIAFAGRACGL